jgi:hypothetical protein
MVTCVNTSPSARKKKMKRKSYPEVFDIVFTGGGGARLTSVFTERIYAVSRQIQAEAALP